MTKVILKEMRLQNYKCFSDEKFSFGEKTEITGANGKGKTSIQDAYLDILCGKTSTGSEPKSIIPHDEDGNEIPKVDALREVVLDINGKNTTICKVTKQKWVKKRGEAEEKYSGTDTSYVVDGFPAKSGEYTDFIRKNIGDPDTVLMCSSAVPFVNILKKSTTDARKVLENLVGFSADEFCKASERFSEVADIICGHKVEDAIKKLKKDLATQTKAINDQNVKISYEQGKKVDVDVTSLKAERDAISAERDRIRAAVIEADEKYDLLVKTYNKKRSDAEAERAANRMALNDLREQKYQKESEVNQLSFLLKQANEEFKKDGERFKTAKAEEFDPKTAVCPTCGRPFDADKAGKIHEKFLADRQTRMDDANRSGAKHQKEIKTYSKKIETMKQEIADLDAKIQSGTEKDYDLTKAYDFLVDSAPKREETDQSRMLRGMTDRLADLSYEIGSAESASVLHERSMETLKKDLSDMAQTATAIARQIDLLNDFSLAKNEELEKRVNKFFSHFRFTLFDKTIDGGVFETCRMMCGGTDYFSLNGGDRRLVEADLCAGFQEMSGMSLPIWIDEANTVDPWRIPTEGGSQIITLYRKDGELEVK